MKWLSAIKRFGAWHDKWEPYLGLAVHYLAFFGGLWIVLSPAPWMPEAAIYSLEGADIEILAWTFGLMMVILSADGRRYNKQRVFSEQ